MLSEYKIAIQIILLIFRKAFPNKNLINNFDANISFLPGLKWLNNAYISVLFTHRITKTILKKELKSITDVQETGRNQWNFLLLVGLLTRLYQYWKLLFYWAKVCFIICFHLNVLEKETDTLTMTDFNQICTCM